MPPTSRFPDGDVRRLQEEGKVAYRRISRFSLAIAVLAVGLVSVVLLPDKMQAGPVGSIVHINAVPQFARRYNLKCSACHTIDTKLVIDNDHTIIELLKGCSLSGEPEMEFRS